MKQSESYYGYVKLSGSGVKGGKIKISDASNFLTGINQNLRFFIEFENPELKKTDYDLEIKIEPGSVWILITGIAGIAIGLLVPYGSSALTQMAKNDIGEKTSADIIKSAVKKMKSTVKISKHVGGMDKKKVTGAKFKDNNNIIGIPNSRGEYLYVRKEEFEAFFSAPKNLYEPMASVVDDNTSLSIGLKDDGEAFEEKITFEDKTYFTKEPKDNEIDDLVLPELVDGQYVRLEGELTRGNGRTNTFGFAYKDHIITCTLKEGGVKDHKEALFGKVKITGQITRHYKSSATEEEKKRPKVIIESIEILETESNQVSFFGS